MNFSLLNPYFLIGLVAVLLPVIAHLISKKSGTKKRFSALTFLLASQGETARRSNIKDLFLLLLRSLVIVLLVIVFAKPAVFSFTSLGAHDAGSVAFIIDNSFSMGYSNNFDTAKNKAKELIESLPDGSFAMVLPLVQTGKLKLGITQDKRKMKRDLNSIELSNSYTDNERRIEEAFGVLQNTPNQRKEVLFFTDLQKNGWTKGDIHRDWLTLIDVSEAEVLYNNAVTDFNIKETEELIMSDVAVTNFQDTESGKILASIFINDDEINSFFQIKPGGTQQKQFSYHKSQIPAGEIVSRVEITPDNLNVDDKRYYVLPREEGLRVLIVDGDPREIARLSETFYINGALETLSEVLSLNLQLKDNDSFLSEDLENYDLIFMANVGDITPNKSEEIKDFIKNGGTLIIFLGNRIRSNVYNKVLYDVLPAEIGSTTEGEFTLVPENFYPELVKSKDRLKGVKVNKLYNLIPTEKSHIILSASNKYPFMIKNDVVKGTVILFASTADLSWNNLSLSPLYLPIIKKLFDLPVSKKSLDRNISIGDELTIEIEDDLDEVTVIDPLGKKYNINRENTKFLSTFVPGIYKVENEGNILYSFAVNIDPVESNLEKISTNSYSSPNYSESRRAKVFKEIWLYFLWAALALFVTESLFRTRTVKSFLSLLS
ncbi:MAG: BatA domain-containing protein [Thermodesulfobacteriota bacterium]